MGKCKDCKWRGDDCCDGNELIRDCKNKKMSGIWREYVQTEGYEHTIYFSADFGCILFEAKDGD